MTEEIDLHAEFDNDEELNNWIDSYLKCEEFINASHFLQSMNRSHVSWIVSKIIFKWNMIKAKSLPADEKYQVLCLYLIERCLKELFCKIGGDKKTRSKFAQAFHAIGTSLECAQLSLEWAQPSPFSSGAFKIPIYDIYNILYILEYRLINAACYSDIEATRMVLAFREHLGLNTLLNQYGGLTDEKKFEIKQEVYSEASYPDYFN